MNLLPPDRKELKCLYCDLRYTRKDLAEHYNVNVSMINRWLKKYKISKEKPLSDDELFDLYILEKYDAKEIGQMNGVCENTIYKWLKDAEISRRGWDDK